MHKTAILVGLSVLGAATTAHAEDAPPVALPSVAPPPAPAATESATATAPPAGRRRQLELAANVVPLGFGRFTSVPGGKRVTEDSAFAYGFNVSAGYEVLPGLTVGLAPQLLFDVKPKTAGDNSYKELDALARVAYRCELVDTIALYAEALPGYSLLIPADGSSAPSGLVVAFGAGMMLDLGGRAFAAFGGGYQVGFQKVTFDGVTQDTRTSFVRFTVGGGARF